MTPEAEFDTDILEDLEETEEMPSYTYAIHKDRARVTGYTDDLMAVEQSVYKILNTERYENSIYSTDYGIELQDLYGGDVEWVIPELEMRIKEALMADERIMDVRDFSFDIPEKRVIHVTFTVETTKGTLETETEVNI